MFKPMIKEPIVLAISTVKKAILYSDGTEFDLTEHNGVMFDTELTEHYGITVIDEEHVVTTYGTQRPIHCMHFSIKNDNEKPRLLVFEKDKYPLAWEFSDEGEMLQKANYYKNWRPTREMIWENRKQFVEQVPEEKISTVAAYDELVDTMIDKAAELNNMTIGGRGK